MTAWLGGRIGILGNMIYVSNAGMRLRLVRRIGDRIMRLGDWMWNRARGK